MSSKDIAIIGMAARLPECDNIHHYWDNIVLGKEMISTFKREDFKEEYQKTLFDNERYIKRSSVIRDIDCFDARFFDFSPREAELTDPQFRLCLETAWEAIEDSGFNPNKNSECVGVYLASNMSDYQLKHLYDQIHGEMVSENEFPLVYQSCMDYLATNVAYKLNLKGPCMNVQNWCTSGLSSIHLACRSLLFDDCDVALAGGVHIKLPQEGYFSQGSVSDSSEGVCMSFNKEANGTVPANGVGIFILKKLDDALRDNDNIYAIIKGSAINNDGVGKNKLSYHSPSIKGQDEVIKKALKNAGVDPDTISFIEAHGGATEFGDRAELTALAKNYGLSGRQTFLGCVKPNIGHMGNISGIPGFIKTIMALKTKQWPPTINFSEMSSKNKKIGRNFTVNIKPVDWKSSIDYKLRACVHNYAVGGSNAHIILEEPPVQNAIESCDYNSVVLAFSAKNNKSLKKQIENIELFHVHNSSVLNLIDIAYNLNTGRKEFEYRHFMVLDTNKKATSISASKIYDAIGTISGDFQGEQTLFLGNNKHNCRTFSKILAKRYKSYKTDLMTCILDIEKLQNSKIYFDSISNTAVGTFYTSIEEKLIDMACQVSLYRYLNRLGIGKTNILADNSGEFIALHLSGFSSFKKMAELYIKASEANSSFEDEEITSYFDLPDAKYASYKNFDGKVSYKTEEISKLAYWSKLIDKGNDTIQNNSEVDCEILDLSALKISTLSEAISSKTNDFTSYDFDILVGQLWLKIPNLNWNAYFDERKMKRMSLPTYPFQKEKFWVSSPLLDEKQPVVSTEFQTEVSQDNIRENLVTLWKKIIGLKEVSPDDDFYTIGGNSFIAVTLLNKLANIYKGLDVSIKDLNDHSNIQLLTTFIYKELSNNSDDNHFDIQKTPVEKLVENGLLEKYIERLLNKLFQGKYNSDEFSLIDIVKDVCFYFKKDLGLVVFTHEIENFSSTEVLVKFVRDALLNTLNPKGVGSGLSTNNFKWLPKNLDFTKNKISQKNKRAVFILSTPRSGSTLLRVMLNSHSTFFAPPELGLLVYNNLEEWNQFYNVSEVSRDGLTYAFSAMRDISFTEARQQVMSLVSEKRSVQDIYSLLQEEIGDKLLVDKTPYYGYSKEILERAEQMFDNPYYIFLHKHPYSMIESFVRNRFDKLVDKGATDPYMMAENEWTEINHNIIAFSEKIDRKRFFQLSFEELVSDPKRVMSDLFQKLNIDFQDSVVDPYKNSSMLVGPGDFNLLSHEGIDSSLGNKWKNIQLPIELKDSTKDIALKLEYSLVTHHL